jgi:hypothetical protein
MNEAAQQGFFDPPRARNTWRRQDPETSRKAAESISLSKVTEVQRCILALLRIYGPLTDEELVGTFQDTYDDIKASPQSIRSRRAELVRKFMVTGTEERRLTEHGGEATVWKVIS